MNKYLVKIIANDQEGLQMISACSSGAKVKISDIKYLSSNKVFLLSIERSLIETGQDRKKINSICRFDFIDKVKSNRLPHMGWNNLTSIKSSSELLGPEVGEQNVGRFYFVHNFYCKLKDREIVTAKCDYEFEFDAVFEKENLFGCQFHPEKSQSSGFEILKRFSKI